MDPKVKAYLAEADAYILRGAPERRLEPLFYGLNRVQLQKALAGFVDLSHRYRVDDRSKRVFWMLSSTAVAKGSSYYALEFEWRIRPDAGTAWPRWVASLTPAQQTELRAWIGKRKAQADENEKIRFWNWRRNEEDTAAAKATAPAPDKRSTSTAVKRFLTLLHQYIAGMPQTVFWDAVQPRKRVLTPAELEACLEALVAAATKYPLNNPKLLLAFEKVSSAVLARCSGFFTLKLEWRCLGSGQKSTWAQLYSNLPNKAGFDADLKAAKKRIRVLDDLKFVYFRTNGADPTFDKLRNFEMSSKPEARTELLELVHLCLSEAKGTWFKPFAEKWDRLAAFYARAAPLDLVLMLKWCREMTTTDHEILDELYWLGVGVLLTNLVTDKRRIELYARGFNDEEKRFFLTPDRRRHPYVGDFELRLLALTRKRNGTEFVQVSKAQALIHLYARKRHLELATIADAARVYDRADSFVTAFEWAKREGRSTKRPPSMTVKQSGTTANASATVTIGESFGDLTVVWIEGHRAYLEARSVKRVLLVAVESTYSHQMGAISQDRFYDVLYENTKALEVVIPAFWQFLAYIPDLVSGGLGGLAKSVLFDLATDLVAERLVGSGVESGILATGLDVAAGHVRVRGTGATANRLSDMSDETSHLQRQLTTQGDPPPARTDVDLDPPLRFGEGDYEGFRGTDVVEITRLSSKRSGSGGGGKGVGKTGSSLDRGIEEDGKGSRRARSREDTRHSQNTKGLRDRPTGTDSRGVPADPPPGTRRSLAGYAVIEDEALLKPLKRAGFQVKAIGLKSPESGGGRYQRHVSDSDAEWRVRSPGGVEADIDALAVDNLMPGGLVAVEAKATFVADPGRSAHLVFYPDKVEQLARQLVLCLESRGLMRLEIVGNATSVAEIYLNITAQQLGRELRKNFARQVKDFIKRDRNKLVKRLSLDDVEQIVENHVTVVVADWGRIKAAKK